LKSHRVIKVSSSAFNVYSVQIANKRLQVCEVIPKVKTSITVMADDDVTWPKTILPWLLAPFEDKDKKIGGVGPCQRVKHLETGTFSEFQFNWLGAAYIERRNFEISATHAIDGGTSCMSGRTCAFRTEILQDPLFLEGFKTERWGQYTLNADDDNFITRWLVNNKWKTWIQYNKECEIETTLENNIKFLYQCSRWSRSNWRSNFTSLVIERNIWSQQPWSTYALHIATFTSLSIVFDPFIIWFAWHIWGYDGMVAQLVFMFGFVKIIKLIPLFIRNPANIKYLPLSIVFGWLHGFIKIYAGLTLKMTSWGSRADGDTNDSERMTPRARRSESITLPPGNHPSLISYSRKLSFTHIEKTGLLSDKHVHFNEAAVDDSVSSTDSTDGDILDDSETSYESNDNSPFFTEKR